MEHVTYDYYDANAVAEESAAARYTETEPPTLCDCGEVAEEGQVYCTVCMSLLDTAMCNAIETLRRCGFTQEQAEQAVCYWIENEDELERRRHGTVNSNTAGA